MKRIMVNLLGLLVVGAELHLQLPTAFAQGTGITLLTTFTNPTPAYDDHFGLSVAAVGGDRVLIAAPYDDASATDAGVAYLFSRNGALLITFTNPTPKAYGLFGWSVAAGTDRVLIGACGDNGHAGAAYLFSTNGRLLRTFTNPKRTDAGFGCSLAAVGTDRVLIGTGDEYRAGAAYLFSTQGTLLKTFANPKPEDGDFFGSCVAAVGTDRLLFRVPADDKGAGTAYLFSTGGKLLRTFRKPTPAFYDFFGSPVAAVGTNQVLIGASGDDTGASDAGAAYLFSINGTLLTTFTNPTPATGDRFGDSLAAVGTDRVLIGACHDDIGAADAGVTYLFGTNGALLATFTNPAPAFHDYFGSPVTAVGTNFVLIGASGDNAGATNAGAAYLFSLEPLLRKRIASP